MTVPEASDESSSREDSISYDVVRQYWNRAAVRSAFSASYMAHEQGLPDDCVRYRFEKESAVVDGWFKDLPSSASILDVGCGAGTWLMHFAGRYDRITGVEQSENMVESARKNLSEVPKVQLYCQNALSFEPNESFDGIFLGGLLMYLNREDVVDLLRRLGTLLKPGGRIVIRESSVRRGVEAKTGDYQVVYRAPSEMAILIGESGLDLQETELNAGYAAMEVAVNLVDRVRSLPGLRSRDVSTIGNVVWSALRLTAPLSLKLTPMILPKLGVSWPHLQNHFYLVRPQP